MRTGEIARNELGNGGGTRHTLPKSQVDTVDPDWITKSQRLADEF